MRYGKEVVVTVSAYRAHYPNEWRRSWYGEGESLYEGREVVVLEECIPLMFLNTSWTPYALIVFPIQSNFRQAYLYPHTLCFGASCSLCPYHTLTHPPPKRRTVKAIQR